MDKRKFKLAPEDSPRARLISALDPAVAEELFHAERAWNALGQLPVEPSAEQVAVARRYVQASRCLYVRPRHHSTGHTVGVSADDPIGPDGRYSRSAT
jgi:hypothetical protein